MNVLQVKVSIPETAGRVIYPPIFPFIHPSYHPFIYLFSHLFNKSLLSFYCRPSIVVNRTREGPVLVLTYSLEITQRIRVLDI